MSEPTSSFSNPSPLSLSLAEAWVNFDEMAEQFPSLQHLQTELTDYRALYSHLPMLHVLLDANGIILNVNRYGEERLGCLAADLVRRSFETLVIPTDREWVRLALQRCVADASQDHRWTFRLMRRDGTTFSAQAIARFVNTPRPLITLLCSEGVTESCGLLNCGGTASKLDCFVESSPYLLYIYTLESRSLIYVNPSVTEVLGYTPGIFQSLGTPFPTALIHPDDHPSLASHQIALHTLSDRQCLDLDYRMRHANGDWRWMMARERVVSRTATGEPQQIMGTAIDMTRMKQGELALRQQADRERLLSQLAHRIRQSLRLSDILNTTVQEVQQLLHADRVLIGQVQSSYSVVVIAESSNTATPSLLGRTLHPPLLSIPEVDAQLPATIQAITDVHSLSWGTAASQRLWARYQIRSQIMVPILSVDRPWGVLIAHQNQPRPWQPWEVDLLQQLSTQVSIAIQQSELYHQVQRLNARLERQVQHHAMQLKLAYDCEDTLKRISDRVRDSLDEEQILQTVVQELTQGLGVRGCNAALFDLEKGISTICYEYTTEASLSQKRVSQMAEFPEIYHQLLQGQYFQFCSLIPNVDRGKVAMFACPVLDDRGILGGLWLINHSYYRFSESDIRLVQQVANQCAIALRQARLYQAAQAQVQELAHLNRLKDDFLSTISHELRTPMTSMKMALQMLGVSLNQELGLFAELAKPQDAQSRTAQYFQILHQECEREIQLIDDLLELQWLNTQPQTLPLQAIDLPSWLTTLVGEFQAQVRKHQQTLELVSMPPNILPLRSNLESLHRVMKELLTNACKYSPEGGTIQVKVAYQRDRLHLQVINTGVEIPPHELPHIFEKFYRVPNADPWKQRGTGLGLALVKQRVTQLGGEIQADSQSGYTCFTVTLAYPG